MKNIKLGIKIGVGFGILILIACILGGMAVINMNNVEEESTRLAEEYVPEVALANELERNVLLAMYAWRGYAFTKEQGFLEEGKKRLDEVQRILDQTKAHADKFPDLVKLRENIAAAQNKVTEYQKQSVTTEEQLVLQDKNIAAMRGAVQTYMENAEAFLQSQNEAMRREFREEVSPEKRDERLEKISRVNHLVQLGTTARMQVWAALAQRDHKILEDNLHIFNDIADILDKLRPLTRVDANIRQIEAIRQSAAVYKTVMEALVTNWQELETLNSMRTKTGGEVLDAAEKTALAGMDQTQNIANNAVASLSTASTIMLFGLAVALILGILVAITLTRSITAPVYKGVDFARKLAQGDLTAQVDVDQKDELGILAQALREMAQKLREVVSEVQSASDNVASGSEELSASAEQLSQGATEQAASVEEVSSSMEQMTSNIRQNADNATQTEKSPSRPPRTRNPAVRPWFRLFRP